MFKPLCLLLSCAIILLSAGCAKEQPAKNSAGAPSATSTKPIPEWKSGYRVFVTNEKSGDLSIIDGSTLEVIATIPLGKRPRGIHASPDGRTIYVALSGSPMAPPGVDEDTLPPPDKSADGIGVFDIEQNNLVKVIEGGSDPENFDVSQDGKMLYVSNEDQATVSFIEIASGKVVQSIGVGGEPEGVRLAPDGKHVYSTSENDSAISVIDVASRKLVKEFKVGRRPRDIFFLPDGSRGYVSAENDGTVTVFDPAKNSKIKDIHLGNPSEVKPMGLALSPDAKTLYVSAGRGRKIFAVDTATDKVTFSVEVGLRPWGIAVSPDGKTLFTANGPANDVSVVDLATQTVTKKINLTGSPWGVLILTR